MPNRERKRVPEDRSDILKGSLLKSPAHPWDTENPSIWGWTKRTRRRIEVKQLGEVLLQLHRRTRANELEGTVVLRLVHYLHVVWVTAYTMLCWFVSPSLFFLFEKIIKNSTAQNFALDTEYFISDKEASSYHTAILPLKWHKTLLLFFFFFFWGGGGVAVGGGGWGGGSIAK